MKCLYSGDKPLGIVQSNAEDVAYDSNTSVKEKIDDNDKYDTDSGTTGSTEYDSFYFGDITVPSGRSVDMAIVVDTPYNAPAFAQVLGGGTNIRVYSRRSGLTFTVKYKYH